MGSGGRHREISAEPWAEKFVPSPLRCFASPSSAVPLGTPTERLHSLKGVGARPNRVMQISDSRSQPVGKLNNATRRVTVLGLG